MSKKTVFKGAAVAITTPFGNDGKIDYNVFEQQIEYQISNKTDAIVVCGTTGEASTLSDEEHKELIRFTVEKVNKRVPVIAGTGSNETSYALELSEHALQAGACLLYTSQRFYRILSFESYIIISVRKQKSHVLKRFQFAVCVCYVFFGIFIR